MEGEDRVRWRMERQESGMEDEGEGKDQWRRGRMGRKGENPGWRTRGGVMEEEGVRWRTGTVLTSSSSASSSISRSSSML